MPILDFVSYYGTYFAAQRTFRQFKPKVSLFFEKGNYYVKTAETWAELQAAMKLRFEVFQCEFKGRRAQPGFDTDAFDGVADHLLIVDKRTGMVVGCYRFICSGFSSQFYSATEFNIDTFLALPGVKLELSRACIHRDFRTGQVMHLLWRGLVQYWAEVGAKYLFGCSSVKSMDTRSAAMVRHYCRERGNLDPSLGVTPLPQYTLPGDFSHDETAIASGDAEAAMPPLLLAYLRAGAQLAPSPALDRDFQCLDFFTVLRLDKISDSYVRRYT